MRNRYYTNTVLPCIKSKQAETTLLNEATQGNITYKLGKSGYRKDGRQKPDVNNFYYYTSLIINNSQTY